MNHRLRLLACCVLMLMLPASQALGVLATNLDTGDTLFAETFEQTSGIPSDGAAYAPIASPQVGEVGARAKNHPDNRITLRNGSTAGYPGPATGQWYLELQRGEKGTWRHQAQFIFDTSKPNSTGHTIRVEFMFYVSSGRLDGEDVDSTINLQLYEDLSKLGSDGYFHFLSFRSAGQVRHQDDQAYVTSSRLAHVPNQWNHLALEYVNGNSRNEVRVAINGSEWETIANPTAKGRILWAVALGGNTTRTVFFVDAGGVSDRTQPTQHLPPPIVASTSSTAAPDDDINSAPVEIGSRRELFVDSHLISRMSGVSLQLHTPTMREVVVLHDQPWEARGSTYHSIFRDGSKYRMYYRASHDAPPGSAAADAGRPREVTCYAESEDGIHWVKPELGLVEFNGSKANNIVLDGDRESHNFAPFKDDNPLAAPDAKYKAVGGGRRRGGPGMIAFQSPDGIHWQRAREEAIIDGLSDEDGRMDSLNVAFYDTVREQYVVFYRAYRDGIRDIKTATSDNFVTTWPTSEWLEYPGAPVEELYTVTISPYPRAPHLFVGFPRRWMPQRIAAQGHGSPDRPGMSDVVFMTSRDGIHFNRWPEALLRPGLRDDLWVGRNTLPSWGVVETQPTIPGMPNELSIYVLEGTRRGEKRALPLRRYTYRLDGFVSVNAPYAGGEMVTRPLIFGDSAGNTQLLLNVSTSAAGAAWIELQDGDGKPLDGYTLDDCDPIIGDAVEFVASWKGKRDLSALVGQPIRMCVVMQDADLYAFQFSAPSENSKPRP